VSNGQHERAIALWPLPLAAGLLPAIAALVAFALAVNAGLTPACNPFIDGCISISRAARHDLPNHVFRALVLPAAVLQTLTWLAAAQTLLALGDGTTLRRSAWALGLIGVAAGIALVLYGSFLGTEGTVYRWLRRYGTVVYFGGTCLAMLLLGRALQGLHAAQHLHLPRLHERVLLALFTLIVALGLGNALAGAWAGAALKDRVENATEWWGSLFITLAFVTLASLWRRWGLRVRITAEP
jgi:hypothetical protein